MNVIWIGWNKNALVNKHYISNIAAATLSWLDFETELLVQLRNACYELFIVKSTVLCVLVWYHNQYQVNLKLGTKTQVYLGFY